jgi:hypothetical protein
VGGAKGRGVRTGRWANDECKGLKLRTTTSHRNPQAIHRQSTGNPQAIHRQYTGNTQAIHRQYTGVVTNENMAW